MKSILEDIKTQNFKQAYLLYGEEAYLKHQYKNKLKNALLPEDDTMNFSRFEGKGTEIPKVIDLAETMPFFADRRVILLENTGFFKNKADALADYMGSLPDYLVLIFVEEEVDKRNRMYKAVQKQGRAVEFARQDEKTLMTWVLGMMKKEGKKITRQDMEDFLEKTGTDMGNISQELEKLLSYTMGRDVITRADIEAVCTTQITNRIFEMIRAVTEKKQRKALDLYQDLLALKEPPMRILFLLARQFNLLLQVKELLAEHCAEAISYDYKVDFQYTIPEEVNVMTDISGLRRLFDNVFSNIMKYGDKREDIRVEAALNGTIVKIVVENHILEQAKKVESTRIGLKTCERICSDLQGTFRYTEEEHLSLIHI